MQIYAGTLDGFGRSLSRIDATVGKGFSGIQLLGPVSEIAKDGIERAKVALESNGVKLPSQKVLMSGIPADLKLEGCQSDLAFAVSVVSLTVPFHDSLQGQRWAVLGELSLDGHVLPVRSILTFVIASLCEQLDGLILPFENRREVESWLQFDLPGKAKVRVEYANHLHDVLSFLSSGVNPLETESSLQTESSIETIDSPLFAEMDLPDDLVRLSLASAIGAHSMLLFGSPGSGKTMLAQRISSLFPRMDPQEHLDALHMHNLGALHVEPSLLAGSPPFRSPHHLSSAAALMGGRNGPGEVSLAHGGLLFLDELPEFRRDVLEALREPLEEGSVHLARAGLRCTWPAKFVLVAAANRCPCGWYGSKVRRCHCPYTKVMAYLRRMSGPLLDRIDIHVPMPERGRSICPSEGATRQALQVRQAELRGRVAEARAFSRERNQGIGILYNSKASPIVFQDLCQWNGQKLRNMLELPMFARYTNRSVARVIRVARSLADLRGSPVVEQMDIVEAHRWSASPLELESSVGQASNGLPGGRAFVTLAQLSDSECDKVQRSDEVRRRVE